MENWKAKIYRLSLHAQLQPPYTQENALVGAVPDAAEIVRILRAQRALGATVAFFDQKGMTGALAAGVIGRGRADAQVDTVYRIASVTKHVVAMACWRLHEAGRIDLNADVDAFLPCSLRHPKAPDLPVTLKRLLSHTAGIHDGTLYNTSLSKGLTLSQMMQGDSFAEEAAAFEYSNLGAGIVACVLEGMLRRSAEDGDAAGTERPVVANADLLVIVTALADPEPRPRMIDRYLERGTVYVLADPDVKCQCVVTEEPGGILEIQNLATVPQAQRHGYGRAMVAYIAEQFRGRCTVLQVGTGDSPSTLGFYRSCGFVPVCRIANYFPEHYDHPIFEDGRQLLDRIILQRPL